MVTVEGTGDQFGLFEKDTDGNVISLELPDRLVIMANHQVRVARPCGVTPESSCTH